VNSGSASDASPKGKEFGIMPIAVVVSKAKIATFLEALAKGQAIQPCEPQGWTTRDMLALAGACFFGASSPGPALCGMTKDPDTLHSEHRELAWENIHEHLHAAIEWYGQVAMLIQDGEYDASLEPENSAIVSVEEGKKRISPIDGWKHNPAP
jgi:hypothetical protein